MTKRDEVKDKKRLRKIYLKKNLYKMEENCSKEILSSMLYRSPYLDPVKSKYFLKRTALRMKDNQNTIQFLQTGKLLCTGKKDRKNKEKERRFRTFADVGGQTWSWKYGHNYQFTTIAAPRRREENRREKQVRVIKGRKCSGKNSRQVWAFILEGLQSRELQKLHESRLMSMTSIAVKNSSTWK